MDIMIAVLIGFGILFGFMLSMHLALCFICWVGDVIENKSWRYWV